MILKNSHDLVCARVWSLLLVCAVNTTDFSGAFSASSPLSMPDKHEAACAMKTMTKNPTAFKNISP